MTAAVSMAAAFALTVIFESAFALICRVRGGMNYLVLIPVNLLTNPLVNALYPIAADIFTDSVLFALEIFAALVEGIIYRRLTDIKRPMLFSFGANAFSFSLGLMLNGLISG